MSQPTASSTLVNRTNDSTNRSSNKSTAESLHPHYYTTFQSSCCGQKTNSSSAVTTTTTQIKDRLPIPEQYKKDVETLLTSINEVLIENLEKIATYTNVIPEIFFEKDDPNQIQRYLIDRVMHRTLRDADITNWMVTTKMLYPIRTSGNGNCLLHAVLIAMIGIHDFNLYLRDRLAQFMTDNQDLLKTHWRIERLKSDKTYGISSEDSKLDDEWKEICQLVHYENSEDGQAATHLEFLEGVHIFAVSNMLRRPIIILSEDVIRNKDGEAISVNDLFGIYLPILSAANECINEPIVLAYDRSHFCPLQTDDVKLDRASDNYLPLYPSQNHIFEGTLLPIRFLGDDVTPERSKNLLHEYLRIKQFDHIYDAKSPAVPVLCAELGTKHIRRDENFFLLYHKYVKDFFEIQKPKAIEEERKRERQRELDELLARPPSSDPYYRSIVRQDTSPTRPLRTSNTLEGIQTRYPNNHSNISSSLNDDFTSSGAYTPRANGINFENHLNRSPRTVNDTNRTQRDSSIGSTQPGLYGNLYTRSDTNNINNLNGNGKMVNEIRVNIENNRLPSDQEQQQQRKSIQIPVQVIKPRSSSNDENLTIYEQRRIPPDICVLCDRPFEDLKYTRICPNCDYSIRYPTSSYRDVLSRPSSSRSRSTNIYIPGSNRSYSPVLSSTPRGTSLHKIICPHCKCPNMSYNLRLDENYRCSACQNPIPTGSRY